MKSITRNQLPGYNGNKLVNYEHVFECGVGCWKFSEKEAKQYSNFTGNETGIKMRKKIISNYTLFILTNLNIFD